MTLQVIGTGSAGNAYALHSETGKTLLLDAGVPIRKIIQALGGLEGVEGCVITHEHNDHSAAANDLASRGVDVYASEGTIGCISASPLLRRFKAVFAGCTEVIGEFTVLPFEAQHDAVQPNGYVIRHEPTGDTLLYATDTYYLRNTFPGVHFWLVECNYTDELAIEAKESGQIDERLRERLITSHMSLRRLKDALAANDLTQTHKIILIHLSDERSDAGRMVSEISDQTGIETVVASAGETINLSRVPF